MNAQTDFFYSINGERETFNVRKDRVVLKTNSEEGARAVSAQTVFRAARTVGYDMVIATIDSLSVTLENLRQISNVADVAFALEYADGTVQMPTNRIFVQFRDGQYPEKVFDLLGLRESIKAIELINEFDEIYMITLGVSLGDILQICRDLFESNLCVFAEPAFIREVQRHNQFFPQQWGLKNTGQSGGTPGIDIKAEPAWAITRGNAAIRVAVIDEGVDLGHPDLQANLLAGFDATVNSPSGANGSPHANNAHGTACAGIIAAIDNSIGIVGVAPNVKIIPVRIAYDRFDIGWWTTEDLWIVNGIRYAWQTAQADVLSNSWGGGSHSSAITAEITAAVVNGRLRNGVHLGCVVVFSSGNDHASTVSYPASLANVIAVGAINNNGLRANFSNHGNALNIVAPGVDIYTTDIQGNLGYNRSNGTAGDYFANFTGTSASTPFVAGVAALLLSVNPNLTQAQVLHAIESTATKLSGYSFAPNTSHPHGTWNSQVGHGLVNAHAALLLFAPHITGSTTILCPSGSFTLHNGTATSWSVSNGF